MLQELETVLGQYHKAQLMPDGHPERKAKVPSLVQRDAAPLMKGCGRW